MDDRNSLVQATPITPAQSTHPLAVLGMIIGGVLALVFLIAGLIAAHSAFLAGAQLVAYAVIGIMVVGVPGGILVAGVMFYQHHKRNARIAELEVERAKAQIKQEDELNQARVDALRAQTEVLRRTISFDGQGNAGIIHPYNGQVQLLRGNMREHPELRTYHNAPRVTGITEEKPQGQALIEAQQLHIPTFRESLNAGLIGPGQEQMLICHVLEQDEETGALTGKVEPYLDVLENNSTVFIGGSSKSGKSTGMAGIGAQGALMNALYYCIDPHLMHPEKSVARKLEALAHAFILPPARTETEIFRVLQHAKGVAQARKDGRETPYADRIIIFIVDEALAVMSAAHRTSSKEVIRMYADLARFMRELGTEYNKFGMNGIFASQYVTKDAFKLPAPAGNIDFRDGCQSQVLMRLPANQAQAMRLLDKDELRGVRNLPQGHGYMGLYSGEIFRMANGNVTRQDIEYVASLAAPSPDRRQQFTVPTEYRGSTQSVQGSTPALERGEGTFADDTELPPSASSQDDALSTRNTGALQIPVKPLYTPTVQAPVQGTGTVLPEFKKRFTPEQEITFLGLFNKHRSIKQALLAMHISYGDYQAYASWLVRQQRGEA
jgi:hypothetical protein